MAMNGLIRLLCQAKVFGICLLDNKIMTTLIKACDTTGGIDPHMHLKQNQLTLHEQTCCF
uniref:Uncharacterized protein n=1 Tax=Helianthus annuus TaxID=4232 RepID=A0A251TCY9_HELAN